MATLDEIVAAAAEVFRTKRCHAATVRDIADEVGILKGSLYHFESKAGSPDRLNPRRRMSALGGAAGRIVSAPRE